MVSGSIPLHINLSHGNMNEFELLVKLFGFATQSICQLTLASVETSEQGGDVVATRTNKWTDGCVH